MKFKDYAVFILSLWAVILLYQIPYFHEEPIFEEIAIQIFVNLFAVPCVLLAISFIISQLFGFPNGRTRKISKGSHRSTYKFCPFFFNKGRVFRIDVHKGLKNFKPSDQHNKLVGMNWGLPRYMKINGRYRWVHPNSVRITVTSNGYGALKYHYYGYYKGVKLKNHHIATRLEGDINDFSVSQGDLMELVRITYGSNSNQYNSFYVPSFGYYLFFYIGGKVKAFMDSSITVYKYSKRVKDSWVQYYSLK